MYTAIAMMIAATIFAILFMYFLTNAERKERQMKHK